MPNELVTFENRAIARCPYSVTLEYVSDYMGGTVNVPREAFVMLPYRAFGLPVPGRFRRRVSMEFDVVGDVNARSRSHEALKFHWQAGTPILPNLHGVIGFRIAGDDLTELVLKCAYEPPFGVVGALFDNLVGRRTSIATGQALLERIIAEIERRERAFSATFPPLTPL